MSTKAKRYEWIEETFVRFRYLELGKPDKGLLLKFLRKVSGYSLVQVKRFVSQYFETGHVRLRRAKKRGFIRNILMAISGFWLKYRWPICTISGVRELIEAFAYTLRKQAPNRL